MPRLALPPLDTASRLQADLCAGGSLVPVAPPAGLPLEQGEWVYGVFAPTRHVPLTYQRYYGAEVVYHTNPAIVVGSPHFLLGYALGTVVQRARLRRKARQLAQPQWRTVPCACAAVTNRRLWCHVNGQWTSSTTTPSPATPSAATP